MWRRELKCFNLSKKVVLILGLKIYIGEITEKCEFLMRNTQSVCPHKSYLLPALSREKISSWLCTLHSKVQNSIATTQRQQMHPWGMQRRTWVCIDWIVCLSRECWQIGLSLTSPSRSLPVPNSIHPSFRSSLKQQRYSSPYSCHLIHGIQLCFCSLDS